MRLSTSQFTFDREIYGDTYGVKRFYSYNSPWSVLDFTFSIKPTRLITGIFEEFSQTRKKSTRVNILIKNYYL